MNSADASDSRACTRVIAFRGKGGNHTSPGKELENTEERVGGNKMYRIKKQTSKLVAMLNEAIGVSGSLDTRCTAAQRDRTHAPCVTYFKHARTGVTYPTVSVEGGGPCFASKPFLRVLTVV